MDARLRSSRAVVAATGSAVDTGNLTTALDVALLGAVW
jgi:hypothetical protein